MDLLIDTKGMGVKRVLDDKICLYTIVLNIFAYVSWFFFILYAYPLQFTGESFERQLATFSLVASTIVLFIVLFYIHRIYINRIYRLKTIESRKRFREEMKAIDESLQEVMI